MSVIDTGGLPYEVILVPNKPYMLTTNIDVADGLANGAMGYLHHIDVNDDGTVTHVWLEFPESPRIGEKLRKKVAAYVLQNNISKTAIPIARRTSTNNVTMNNNKTMFARRSHLPIVSACAITIHKAQGGTFTVIVYEYKTHSQQLLYVALSRVTSIEGLYIVTSNNDSTFYHGRRRATSMDSLQGEFRRLSLNRLVTVVENMKDFISKRKGLSVYSLNCQSLSAHVADFTDTVTQQANILLLSETWLKNEDSLDIPNFDCVCHFKRPHVRTCGVAIYRNYNDTSHLITPHIDLTVNQTTSLTVNATEIGEMCAAHCTMENGETILLATVYISPGSSITAVITFIHKILALYTSEVAAIIGSNDDKIPMILTGDFNINFGSEEAKPLIEFLKQKLHLAMNADAKEGTTRHGTTIDAVFARFLDRLQSRVFILYFSYHKPIVSFLEIDDAEN